MALQLTPITSIANIGSAPISFETGKVAKQADGSIIVRAGDTMVLVTVVAAKEKKEGMDFFPLTVEFQEKLYAGGKIPGSYFRREGRPTEKEILSARLIDRSLRPLFPENFQNEVQIIITVLSVDGQNEPDSLALSGASAALAMSNIPFHGLLAGVRVGRIDGHFIANPTAAQRALSDIDFIIGASENAISMVEGGAKEVSEAAVVDALLFGHAEAQKIIAAQRELVEKTGGKKAPREYTGFVLNPDIKAKVFAQGSAAVKEAYKINDKHARGKALNEAKKATLTALTTENESYKTEDKQLKAAFEELKYEYVRKMIVNDKIRIGGRTSTQIRDIATEVAYLPRAHGSALFTRGETQALAVVTMGTSDDAQEIETLTGDESKKFMLHYNFPPYSVGEIKRLATARREVGHGALAERALKAVLPDEKEFPYTIRLVSEVLESNGSSSMATVCGGTLALMDAGVAIKAPVAGIAMGLIKEGDGIAILSDILGDEDHLGDMDFKVCGTAKGITALQMDIKITGVDRAILQQALDQAREGRLHILGKMAESLTAPRAKYSDYAPRIVVFKINPEKIRDVIGPGGKMIREIVARTGCKVDIEDNGSVSLASNNGPSIDQAMAMIKALTQEAELNKVYLGTVRRVVEFGAFVEILPGIDGLLHVSEMSDKRIKVVSDVVKEGDELKVKVLAVDEKTGKIRLSRKDVLAEEAAAAGTPPAEA